MELDTRDDKQASHDWLAEALEAAIDATMIEEVTADLELDEQHDDEDDNVDADETEEVPLTWGEFLDQLTLSLCKAQKMPIFLFAVLIVTGT